MSTQNGPFALKQGQHEVFGSAGWSGHSQVLTTSYVAGEDLWEQVQGQKQFEEEDFRQLLDAGLAWALFFPGPNVEFAYRTGLPGFTLPKWDLGIRTDGQVMKYDLRLQFLESGVDWKQGGALIVSHGFHVGVVNQTLQYLTLTNFSRHDIDAQLSYGLKYKDYFEAYINPRMMASYVDAEPVFPQELIDKIPESLKDYDPNQLFEDVWLTYYGMGLGVRAGYKYIFVFAEANMFWMNFRPIVLGEERDMSGLTFAPRLGLMGRF